MLLLLLFNFTVHVAALEKIWIIGEDFVFRTIEEYYIQRDHKEYNGFVKEHFDVFQHSSSKYACTDKSVISRIRNQLANAIKEETTLPKLVVVVLDDDILRAYDHSQVASNIVWDKIIFWLMWEFKKLTMLQKDFLPARAK